MHAAGLGMTMLGGSAHAAGMRNVDGILGEASFGEKAGSYFSGAGSGAWSGMKAGFSEMGSGFSDKMSAPAMNEGSFVNGIASHFNPEKFGPQNPGGAGGSARGAGG